jgi:hypothetical protein
MDDYREQALLNERLKNCAETFVQLNEFDDVLKQSLFERFVLETMVQPKTGVALEERAATPELTKKLEVLSEDIWKRNRILNVLLVQGEGLSDENMRKKISELRRLLEFFVAAHWKGFNLDNLGLFETMIKDYHKSCIG